MWYLLVLHLFMFVLGGPPWGLWPHKAFLAVGFGWFHHPESYAGAERWKPAFPRLYCIYHLQILWSSSPAISPLSSTCLSGSRLPGEPQTWTATVIVCAFHRDLLRVSCFFSQWSNTLLELLQLLLLRNCHRQLWKIHSWHWLLSPINVFGLAFIYHPILLLYKVLGYEHQYNSWF